MDLNLAMMINEDDMFEETLQSCSEMINNVIILNTGLQSTDKIENICKKYDKPLYLKTEKFEDFATTRNILLKYCEEINPNCYLLLLDADDIFHFEYDFRDNIFQHNFDAYVIDRHWHSKTENSVHKRIAFIKSSGFEFVGSVHETLKIENKKVISLDKIYITQNRDNSEKTIKRMKDFDIPILLRDLTTAELKDRIYYYLGNSHMKIGMPDLALHYFQLRLKHCCFTNQEETYQTYLEIGKILDRKEDVSCIDYYFKAYNIRPYLEPIRRIVQRYIINDNIQAAYKLMQLIKDDETKPLLKYQKDIYNIKDLYAYVCAKMCLFKEGSKYIENNQEVFDLYRFTSNVIVMNMAYCIDVMKTWDIDSLGKDAQLGGSEINFLNLAKKLSKHYNVVFCCNTGYPMKIKENILFINLENYDRFLENVRVKALLVGRFSEFVRYGENIGKTFLLLDDPHYQGTSLSYQEELVVVTKSTWHKELMHSKFPQIKNIIIIPNALDTARYSIKPKERFSIVYSSYIYRGLEQLLEMYPRIREKIDCKLYLYVIKQEYDECKKMISDVNDGSIILNHRKSYVEWPETLADKDIWIYTPTFNETFCITAIEMRLSNVLCIHSNTGGLSDTVGQFGIKYENVNTSTNEVCGTTTASNIVKSIDQIVEKIKDGCNDLRKVSRDDATKYDWANIIDRYIEIIN